LAGGLNSADVEIYSPNGTCSNSLAPLPEETTSPRLAYINQEIFYCPSQNSMQCYIYDFEANTWNTYTSMNYLHTKTASKHIYPSLFWIVLSSFFTTNYCIVILLLMSCGLVSLSLRNQGGNSQNFFCKFVRFFLTLKLFYRVVIHRK